MEIVKTTRLAGQSDSRLRKKAKILHVRNKLVVSNPSRPNRGSHVATLGNCRDDRQIAVMLAYTALISWLLPHYWFDPFQGVGKNLALLAVSLWLLWLPGDPGRSEP